VHSSNEGDVVLAPNKAIEHPVNKPFENSINAPRLCILCTVLKNEARFVKEWIEFHHLAGFDKVVLYDDGSTDNLLDVLNNIPSDYYVYNKVDWKYNQHRFHVQTELQQQVISKCLDTYWDVSQVIAFADVDEFMFPCRDSWTAKDMWADVRSRVASHVRDIRESMCNTPESLKRPLRGAHTPFAMSTPCLRYGINGQTNVDNIPSVVDTYRRRASYEYLDEFDNFTGGESTSEMMIRYWSTRQHQPQKKMTLPMSSLNTPKMPASLASKRALVYGTDATYEACLTSPSMCARSIGLRKGVYFPNSSRSQDIFPNSSSGKLCFFVQNTYIGFVFGLKKNRTNPNKSHTQTKFIPLAS